jgi:hypothetical protein
LSEFNPVTDQFRIVTIQRKNTSFIRYEVQTSSNLSNFSKFGNVNASSTNIGGTDYRRVTITFTPPPLLQKYFARLKTNYDP